MTTGPGRRGGARAAMAGAAAVLPAAVVLAAACAAPPDGAASPEADAVYALVLGTAQDAGVPQLGCFDRCCEEARRDPRRRRLASSVLIVDARSGRRWLLDCGPDLEEQVALARGHGRRARDAEDGRPPLFDGVFLTHAHLGHYAGLLELGPEAYAADGQRVWATERMQRFLLANDPFAFLIEGGALTLERLAPGAPVELAEGLSVEPLSVPHRDELSDTVGFVVRGPRRSLLYLPDIDKWERWERDVAEVVGAVDVALVDGTFFDDGEVPGRAMSEIPHPFVVESLARLEGLDGVWFTHLNHTNPAAVAGSAAEGRVRGAGMGVAREGMVFGL